MRIIITCAAVLLLISGACAQQEKGPSPNATSTPAKVGGTEKAGPPINPKPSPIAPEGKGKAGPPINPKPNPIAPEGKGKAGPSIKPNPIAPEGKGKAEPSIKVTQAPASVADGKEADFFPKRGIPDFGYEPVAAKLIEGTPYEIPQLPAPLAPNNGSKILGGKETVQKALAEAAESIQRIGNGLIGVKDAIRMKAVAARKSFKSFIANAADMVASKARTDKKS